MGAPYHRLVRSRHRRSLALVPWEAHRVLECVVNVSEGREPAVLDALAAAAGADLLDLHSDPHHHRSVLTLVGEEAVRAVADVALERVDLGRHHGVHPRLGAVDVVPFVPLGRSDAAEARAAQQRFMDWWSARGVPCFRYGEDRPLPEVRRRAFRQMLPDAGPSAPHPTAGATAVGVRPVLVAYNVWLIGEGALAIAKAIAREIRRPALRAIGLAVGEEAQVSMNLVDPVHLGPAAAYDLVAQRVDGSAIEVRRAELVGLVPAPVLDAVPRHRWSELDLAPERTIESRLEGRAGAT
jgi:glutamate formiminotransferase / 5-formyltetrahydrofolate cyclo-ligase